MTVRHYGNLDYGRTNFSDLDPSSNARGFLDKRVYKTPLGNNIHILTVDNGELRFNILFERGMDIGQVWYQGKQLGWNRDLSFLKHPNEVNLKAAETHVKAGKIEGLGWLQGFYAMDAMVGPSHFGGPCKDSTTGEEFTLHDKNSYSPADMDGLIFDVKNNKFIISGDVPISYNGVQRFKRMTEIETHYGQNSLVRHDLTSNVSDKPQILDDGHHIQFGGALVWGGSQYVVSGSYKHRDAEAEKHIAEALQIPSPIDGFFPERCYFIEPNAIGQIDEVTLTGKSGDVTAQMIKNVDSSLAGFVAHRLAHYSKVTLWEQFGGWQFDPENKGPIWYTAAIEPANSFPDDRDNKSGLKLVEPQKQIQEIVEIGAVAGPRVAALEDRIRRAG